MTAAAALDIALLDRLRHARGEFVPWSALGAEPTRVAASLTALGDFGFGIEQHPTRGAAYRAPSSRLCPDQIEHDLGTKVIGRQLAVWNRVGSTNDMAAHAAASRSNHGLAILAEQQTAGRGSRGRVWTAPAGSSILLSVLLFPPPALADPVWLNAFAAVSVAEVLAKWLGREKGVTIKWPNDIRIDGRKVAGILVERGKGTVIGIGLNVNLVTEDFPADLRAVATSLAAEIGRPVDRSALARDLLQALDRWYDRGITLGPDNLDGGYESFSEHVWREVEVATDSETVVGRLQRIDFRLGLTIGPSHRESRTIPMGGFSAITNLPGSTRWTLEEESAWWGRSHDMVSRSNAPV